MNKSLWVQSASLSILGLVCFFFPKELNQILLISEDLSLIRALGILSILVGIFYYLILLFRAQRILLWSIPLRYSVACLFLVLTFTNSLPETFLLVAGLDIFTATWTAIEEWIPQKRDLLSAFERVRPYVLKTDVKRTELNEMHLFVKCENRQKIGAFKARGAMNAALKLSKTKLQKGLLTHSSGNHAQAIALAAKELGTNAFVVMPENAPKVKKEGVLQLGGKVFECEPTLQAREKGVQDLKKEKGAEFIHPFDNYHVICGQSTVAQEIFEELNPDVIIAPVGGGGLLSGTALASSYLSSGTLVYGAEPTGALDAFASFKSGKVEKAVTINTIADGLLTNLSPLTLKIIRRKVKDILPVSEGEIIKAMQVVKEHFNEVIEPSAAVSVAAAIKFAPLFKNKKVVCILTGGNIDKDRYTSLLGPDR